MSTKRILIVGAGPTGASLALLLAQRGIEVILIERETHLHRLFRGEGMMPSGLEALAQMGLREHIERLPHRKLDRWEYYLNGRCLASFPEPDKATSNAIRVLSQPHLLEMLITQAGQFPHFQFESGWSVVDLVRNGQGRIGVVSRSATEERTIWGDFVVATDGRASLVRKCAELQLDRSQEHSKRNYDAVWCSLPLPEWLEEETVFYGFACADSLATMYPSPTGELRLGWMIPKGASGNFQRLDMIAEVAKRVPAFVGEYLISRKAQASEPAFFKVLFGRCPSWTAPGILLLGDAAHPMNPTRAQGINLGLRDAIVAANRLVPVLQYDRPVEDVDAAAAAIQREREPEIIIAQKLQLKASGPPPVFDKAWFRSTILPLLQRLRIPQRMILRTDRPLRTGVCTVRLTV